MQHQKFKKPPIKKKFKEVDYSQPNQDDPLGSQLSSPVF